MFLKHVTSILMLSLILSACAGITSTPPIAVTENSQSGTPGPTSPAAYPVATQPIYARTQPAYPAPITTIVATPTIVPSDYEPQPGDDKLRGDTAFVDISNSNLVFSPGSPVEVNAALSGNLPTSCHQLRVLVSKPDENNVINVKAYSVVDPGLMCATVIEPFEVTIPLGAFSTGQYKVFVNDEGLSEFGIGYPPQSGDESLTRGQVYLELDKSELLTTTTKPVQASVVLNGTLPNPCHQLRVVVNSADKNNVINLEAYSLSDGSRNCIAVIAPFQAVIPLGEYTQGHYTVKVNGELLAEFDG